MMQTKVGHFISIARVPDCVRLLPFEQLREAFNSYTLMPPQPSDLSGCTVVMHCSRMSTSSFIRGTFHHDGPAGPDNTVWYGR